MARIVVILVSLLITSVCLAMELSPGESPKSNRIFILVHGFSSLSFEWTEGEAYIKKHCSNCAVELVSLGKHASLEDLRNGTWQEWAKPIFDTCERLILNGHTNIILVLSSAAASLILENLTSTNSLFHKPGYAPRKIIFIDPLVRPRSQFLWLMFMLQYLPFDLDKEKPNQTEGEKQNSFSAQPMAALAQLYNLTSLVEERLKSGFRLPAATGLQIFFSQNDPVVDPESVKLITAAVLQGNVISRSFDSNKHIFTRLRERDPAQVSPQDKINQEAVFAEILAVGLPLAF